MLKGLRGLVYEKHGAIQNVLRLSEYELPNQLSAKDVLVKFLCSPINPSDINMIEGVYPITKNS
jgi:trans-2-enoyl-CoA reductase